MDTIPEIMPLGDRAILVRFARELDDAANRRAIGVAATLEAAAVPGVLEVAPSLVSVLVRYDARQTDFGSVAGEIRLQLSKTEQHATPRRWQLKVRYGGSEGPDLPEVAAALNLDPVDFLRRHKERVLRVLATGFAPGFVYCGFHSPELTLPRRKVVRQQVPPGSVLFAAGQTAISATQVPTGWHVIGHTEFCNFDASAEPPTKLLAGDEIMFEPVE